MQIGCCILGWHFELPFYLAMQQVAVDRHIVSHRDAAFVNGRGLPAELLDTILYEPNIGLDWGGYHQFNERGLHRKYDVVIYCHDDLEIRDPGFPEAVGQAFGDPGIMVVGNGRNGKDTEFRFVKYKDRMFTPDVDDFIVRTVRGSFVAVRTSVFDTIGNFPVYWKTQGKSPKKGNISLRNFGYVITKQFGRESISYLEKDSWLETRFLVELCRGERKKPKIDHRFSPL